VDNTRLVHVGQDRLEGATVHNLGTAESGELKPDDEKSLEGEVPREVVKYHSQGKALQEVEETEHGPVCQPLDIISNAWGFDSPEGEVSRESPANEVGDRCSEGVDEVEDSEEEDTAENCVSFGNLGPLFKVVKNGIFRELLVKLSVVVVGLVAGLDVHGVLLHFCCGVLSRLRQI